MKPIYKFMKYIYWDKEAHKKNLTQEQFTSLYKTLDKRFKCISKTDANEWCQNPYRWRYDKKNGIEHIYLYKNRELYDYSSYYMDDKKNNEQEVEPGYHFTNDSSINGLKEVKDKFTERTSTTLRKAFGFTEEEFKKYIPHQFHYNIFRDNLRYNNNTILYLEGINSIDFSSMYPSSMCGKLPDSHTMIEVEGCVEPNEEYEFAFYPDTGHIAIYREFDSHDWIFSEYQSFIFRTYRNMTRNDKVEFLQDPFSRDKSTILMKRSKYELTDEYRWAYDRRKLEEIAKAIMNQSIGKMHRKNYTRDKYAHLVAVCIARSNNKMLESLKSINIKDVIQICVDGIMYSGDKRLGVDESNKDLGVPVQEYYKCNVSYGGNNRYIVCDSDKVIKYKNAGCNYYKNGNEICDETVKNIKDIEDWIMIQSEAYNRMVENNEA